MQSGSIARANQKVGGTSGIFHYKKYHYFLQGIQISECWLYGQSRGKYLWYEELRNDPYSQWIVYIGIGFMGSI